MLSNMSKVRKKRKLESENLFSKKRKVTSKTSTPSFNKKNNEIYYENHDHSIIDCVHDDCLAEIFMYVPAWERPKLALVCQKWKRVLNYSWGSSKKLQLTHWEQAEYSNCLKKYSTPDEKLSFLNTLLYKCGRYLTQLDLTAYGYSDIVPVINEYCPNLVKLRLRFAFDHDKMLFCDVFSRLSKLKVLTVIFQYHLRHHSKLHYLMIALESLADTLTDLTLFNWEGDDHCTSKRLPLNIPCTFPKSTLRVLPRLKALKRFEFGGIKIFRELREYLLNNSAIHVISYDLYVKKVLKLNQLMFSITKLDLFRYHVLDDSLYTIANTMKQLTTLKINCEWITNDGVVAISKMNNITYLSFSGNNDSIDSASIKLLRNLNKVLLPGSKKINDDVAIKVLENSPKIATLFVPDSSVTVEFIKKAAEISRNRKQLLTSAVSFIIDIELYESPYFKIICVNNKLNN
ncbi:hypothetical protein HCN44_009491 [Aphidius gifuensis]|uniref:F-box domain-containing protein n=1 Tax=Aphidius gifuensis TaxID=684658 RepID=A0A834Y6M5_APHGI|nr:uncharacterized protein LOC122860256 [Aphidius gifuensis]KAF7998093.1 hypothetical protein HCN44_009491 [Aphidius gifuensis]